MYPLTLNNLYSNISADIFFYCDVGGSQVGTKFILQKNTGIYRIPGNERMGGLEERI